METKMKPYQGWHSRAWLNLRANILYPHLADPEAQRDMAFYSKQEGRLSPMEAQKTGFKDRAKPEARPKSPKWWND